MASVFSWWRRLAVETAATELMTKSTGQSSAAEGDYRDWIRNEQIRE